MTTYVNFNPPPNGPFQFRATLDGNVYNCIVAWNIVAGGTGRYYISVYALDGTRVFTLPLISSAVHQPIVVNGAAQAVSSMTWTSTNGGQVFVVMASPSPFALGNTIVVSGATNSGSGGNAVVNGTFVINTWSNSQNFTFLLPATAGVVGTIAGTILISPTAGAITWSNGVVTASVGTTLPFQLGSIVNLSVANCSPSTLNGTFPCIIATPLSFSYALPSDPGPITALGDYGVDLNLAGGYFTTSTLIWRGANNQFEINP